jgi:hypothetical protein
MVKREASSLRAFNALNISITTITDRARVHALAFPVYTKKARKEVSSVAVLKIRCITSRDEATPSQPMLRHGFIHKFVTPTVK